MLCHVFFSTVDSIAQGLVRVIRSTANSNKRCASVLVRVAFVGKPEICIVFACVYSQPNCPHVVSLRIASHRNNPYYHHRFTRSTDVSCPEEASSAWNPQIRTTRWLPRHRNPIPKQSSSSSNRNRRQRWWEWVKTFRVEEQQKTSVIRQQGTQRRNSSRSPVVAVPITKKISTIFLRPSNEVPSKKISSPLYRWNFFQ
jgi:hypothetical protein